jgi:hypothetical protein
LHCNIEKCLHPCGPYFFGGDFFEFPPFLIAEPRIQRRNGAEFDLVETYCRLSPKPNFPLASDLIKLTLAWIIVAVKHDVQSVRINAISYGVVAQ